LNEAAAGLTADELKSSDQRSRRRWQAHVGGQDLPNTTGW